MREVRWREMECSYFILYSTYPSKCVYMHIWGALSQCTVCV